LILVFTPLQGHNTDHKNLPSRDRCGTENPRRDVGGEGACPLFPRKCKVKAQKLALASAKPTLTVKVFAHEFLSLDPCERGSVDAGMGGIERILESWHLVGA
jgi:hypothetical protein